MWAAGGIDSRDGARTEIPLRPSAAELLHGTGGATKIIETLIRAALTATTAGVVVTPKARLAGTRVGRAVGLAFSFVVTLAGGFEMALTATLAVTVSFAWSGQELRLRRQ